MPGRTPAMVAQTAATIDALCGGRLHLGLGTSGPQVSEGWHG
jgi:alkanesulfonate monooxygenase SsuD/methylene tetrahydromethanopterin reductase-like flavin-dependent oxidoreductase (luciferase family)